MLSVFPDLLNYSLFGVFILRITIGILFLRYGIIKIFRKPGKFWKFIGFLETAGGLLMILGLFTQVASLLIFLLMVGAVAIKIKTKDLILKSSYDFYILLGVISFAILFLGPGLFSIDFPL